MTGHELLGRVVVVAGDGPRFDELTRRISGQGAHVARVSTTAQLGGSGPAAMFRADPADPAVWERIGMHVEQHLGPVDAVVADAACAGVVAAHFDADLARRGRPPTQTIGAGDDVATVVSGLGRTP